MTADQLRSREEAVQCGLFHSEVKIDVSGLPEEKVPLWSDDDYAKAKCVLSDPETIVECDRPRKEVSERLLRKFVSEFGRLPPPPFTDPQTFAIPDEFVHLEPSDIRGSDEEDTRKMVEWDANN